MNAADIGQTKAQSGTTTGANFRTDVTVNGTINAAGFRTGGIQIRAGHYFTEFGEGPHYGVGWVAWGGD